MTTAEERKTSRPRCVIFMHVPKTAGQTLYAILARQYDWQGTVTIENPGDPLTPFMERSRREPPCLVRGHLLFGVHEQLGIEPTYITILREPINRVISTYKYITRNVNHPLHATVRSQRLTLSGFVRSDIDRQEVVNGQTRQLAGRWQPDPDEEALQKAKQNLQRFAEVGLTERFDESLILFRRKLGWKLPLYISKNVAQDPMPDPLPAALREVLEERNQLDLELYRFATELFERETHAAGIWFRAELLVFRSLNRVAGLYKR